MKIKLRGVAKNDLPIFFDHQCDEAATEMAAFKPRDKSAFVSHWELILGDDTVSKRTILFGGNVVGYVVSFERSGRREVGYWIGREYWGKGIATDALRQFLERLRIRPLYAIVAKHNAGSLRVLEKCGFTMEGEMQRPVDDPGPAVGEYVLKLAENEGL